MIFAKARSAGLFLSIVLLFSLPMVSYGQCVTAELIMINSCIEHTNPNGGPIVESEIIVMRTGLVPVPVNTIGIDLPFNGFGAQNGDLGYDIDGNQLACAYTEPTITSLPGCPNAIPAGPNDIIPPNAFIVLFLTSTTVTEDVEGTDFANICADGQPVYILQSACERTTGAFANGPGQGNQLRSLSVSSPCGIQNSTYNTSVLDPDDGTYYLVGTSVTGNMDCDLPTIPVLCSPIDTTFYLCGYGDEVAPPIPISDFNVLFSDDILLVSIHASPEDAELSQNRITEYTGMTNQPDTLYSRVIYSDNLCVAVSRFIIQFPDDPLLAMSPSEPVRGCDPLTTGIGVFNLRLSDLEIGGGTPVTWYTDPVGTQEINDPTNFISGATTVYAIVGLGACRSNPVPVELELSSGPATMVVTDSTSCAENADGAIALSAAGFGPFEYDWNMDEFDGNAAATVLSAGQYQVTITDRYGCSEQIATEVFPGLPLEISCNLIQGVSDNMTDDGSVQITFNQGEAPFQLTYSGAAAGTVEVNEAVFDLTNLPAGDYTFSATDANGCASEVCELNVPSVNPLTIQCRTRNNSNDVNVFGSGQVEIADGVAPLLVRITDANGNSSDTPNRPNGITVFPNLPSGQYTITVIDATGVTETCTINIALSACPLTVVDVQELTTDCSGSSNTIIRLTIAGNEGSITTMWSGGNGIDSFNGMQEAGPLPPGVYFVTIGDQSGCPPIMEGPIVITDPGLIDYSIGGNFTASPCMADARIDVTLNGGGNPPYTVVLLDWNTSAELDRITGQSVGTTVSFDNLVGGGNPDYAVYIIDAFGCETDRTFNPITASPEPDIVLNLANQQITSVTCAGDSTGMLTLLASGGTAPYVYRWIGYPQQGEGRILTDGPEQTDLPAGNYTIEITDANGCQDTAMIAVSEGTSPQINCGPVTNATPNQQGSVGLTLGSGLAPYVVSLTRQGNTQDYPNLAGPNELVTGLEPGDYSAVARDANGCLSDTCSFTISGLVCEVAVVAVIDTIVCANFPEGGIDLQVLGGTPPYILTWAGGVVGDSSSVQVFSEGDYSVVIEDVNGCRLDTSFFVPDIMNRLELILEQPRSLPACPGDDISIPLEFSGTAPFTLDYFVNPAPGVDFFRTFNTNMLRDTLVIPATDFVDDELRVSVLEIIDRYCTVDINQTFVVRYESQAVIRRTESTCTTDPVEIGGRFFDVQNPSDTFFFDDGSACGVIYEVDLNFLAGTVSDTIQVPICAATNYLENGETFNANRPEGEVRYLRDGLCDSLVYIRLDFLPEFIGSFSDNACVGDTIFYADRFFTAENTSGLARLPGMAATGCDSLVFVTTSFRRTGEVRLFGDFEVCPGDAIELRFTYDGPGGINVLMTDLAGNQTNLPGIRQGSRVELFPTESTTYRLLSSSIGGCPGGVAGASSVIVNDLSVGAEVLLDPADYCQDTLGLATVSYAGGTGPYDITWSNGPSDSINRNLLAGTYRVSVTDAIGCTMTDSVVLNNLIPLTARVTGIPPVCPGDNGSVQIDTIYGGGGFYEVSIDGQLFLPIERIGEVPVAVGNHRAVFQGGNDCSVAVDFVVNDAVTPDFGLPTDTTIFLGDSIFLDGSLLNQDSAWWTPQTFLSTPNSAATWAAPLRSSSYTLHLRTLAQCLFTHEVNIIVDERLLLFAPSAFSPNGDGTNDIYSLGLGHNVRALRAFQIFNRWGSLMYEGLDGWNGEFSGGSAPPAVYVYYVTVEMADGSERFVKGDFVLMR